MSTVISTKQMNHEEWLRERQKGIGGSDVGAIMGLNPWKSPLDVYLEKVAEEPVIKPDTPKMKAGRELEEVIARWWTEETGLSLRRDNKIRKHPAFQFLLGNIDRIIISTDGRGPGILEIKTTSSHMMKKWQNEGWPYDPNWHCQIQHYMNVTGYDWGEFAVLVDGWDFQRIEVERDQEFIDTMTDACVQFWQKHVLTQTPPEPQNEQDVLKLYPEAKEGAVLEATDELFHMVMDLKEIKQQIDLLEEAIKTFEEAIKTLMKDNEVIVYEGEPIVTWKTVVSKRLDSKALQKEAPEIYNKFTKEYVSRRFLLKVK